MSIDKGKILFGEPIEVCEGITLYQPKLGGVMRLGCDAFMNTFTTLCSAAYDMPSFFDDMGVDFMKVSDWEYFRSMSAAFGKEQTSLIFGDLDFSEFKAYARTMDGDEPEIVLAREDGFIITEDMYKLFIPWVQEIIGFSHVGRKAANRATAKILIMDDRKRRERSKKDNSEESMLFNAIISLVNTEEFPYTYETVKEVTLYQFMKSLVQIQGKKAACALYQGSMSGFVDTKNIDKRDMSWMYSEDKYKPRGKKLINNKTK